MRARDLAVEYETVSIDTEGRAAAQLMAEHRLPALLVVDDSGAPKAILPASQMIKILVRRTSSTTRRWPPWSTNVTTTNCARH